eukprot:TRINITY_DN7342_c0_g1_i17.p5 TRINITY_DN7342_c0_g1~~TRINITY_DN7342_c0_g1_i17.p5  ORF type:complete len:142 (-),score=37.83 TRINITY_DN7342_c0_g1_i17:758-1123(-)
MCIRDRFISAFPMEILIWFWLFDKRWFFGMSYPNASRAWYLPIAVNFLLFMGSAYVLIYELDESHDRVYFWCKVKVLGFFISTVACFILSIQALFACQKEKVEMKVKPRKMTKLALEYSFW